MGISLAKIDTEDDLEGQDTPTLVEDIDFGGLSLDNYLKVHGQEEFLQEDTELLSVEECEYVEEACVVYAWLTDLVDGQENDTLEDLHKSIQVFSSY